MGGHLPERVPLAEGLVMWPPEEERTAGFCWEELRFRQRKGLVRKTGLPWSKEVGETKVWFRREHKGAFT